MAFIVKKGVNLKNIDRKTAYTWGACGLVVLFLLLSMFAFMGGDNGNPDQFDGLSSRGFDLAALPFVNDAAEQELLARYRDIAERPVVSGLYTPEEKEERQERDAIEGVPAAPDMEYYNAEEELAEKKAAREKDKEIAEKYNTRAVQAASARGSAPRPAAAATQVERMGSFNSGGRMGGGGGSRTTWSPGNTVNRNQGNNNNANAKASAAAIEKLKKSEKGRQLLATAATTADAKKAGGERALKGASDAFQGGKSLANPDDMAALSDITLGEGDAGGLDGAGPSLNDLKNSLDDAKKNNNPGNNKDKPDPPGMCDNPTGKDYWKCLGKEFLNSFAQGFASSLGSGLSGMIFPSQETKLFRLSKKGYNTCVDERETDSGKKATAAERNACYETHFKNINNNNSDPCKKCKDKNESAWCKEFC